MNAPATAIRFDDVCVTLADEIIHEGLNLDVAEGEFVCIVGPSGCGKSTALRLISDLLAPVSGRVEVLGKAPEASWDQVAFVFQSPRLAPWRNALRNVTLSMELRFEGRSRDEMESHARELLDMVGLANDMHKYPRALSGGERQRVAIARALAVDPRIILMDEPFSALDPNTRARMREEIVSIWQATRKTIVFVTHDIDEALTLADRVILLSRKPTKVMETLSLTASRPRNVRGDSALAAARDRLHSLFDTAQRS